MCYRVTQQDGLQAATFTYTATDGNSDTVELTFTIVVTAPAFSFASTIANQAWTVDTAVTVTLPTATGGVGTLAYSLSSGLPSGVTFTGSTRALAGTPTGRFTSASFTYTVTDDEGETSTQTFTIVVTATAITFASNVANQSWTVGTAVNLTLPAASGGVGAFTYSLTPTLPAGVSRSVRAVTGTPTAAVVVATYTYTAEDSEGETLEQTFTIVVVAAAVALGFGSETIDDQAWVVGTAITSLTLPEATGGTGDKTYTLSPTTPAGVAFTGMTRVLAGNPIATFTSATFTYTATDEDDDTVELTFTIVVTADALVFASTVADQSWVVGTAVDETLPTASGGVGDLTYSLSPTTPAGVTFTASTRALAGNPTAVFTSATFTYTVTDAESETLDQTFTIVVSAIAETQAQVSTEATYNADLGYNQLPEALGALKKISSSGTVESLGNLWYEKRPYNISATRALSIDGSLHLTMGYGEPDAVLRSNSLASQADNIQHLVYGEALHFVVPSFESGGSIYDALADIALRINATLSIDKGIITISDRRPYMALADGATGTGTGNLDFDSENKAFPSSGYLIIDYEFIGYTGISSGAFTGVSRGVIGTTVADHADTAEIVYVDAVIRPSLIKGDLGYINDVNRIYNIIRNPSGTVEVRDADSIARYGELPYTLDLGLTDHDRAWQEEVFDRYLQDLKDLHRLIDVSVQPGKDTLGLQLGQIIGFRYSRLVYAGRVVAITYGSDAIGLRVRTL